MSESKKPITFSLFEKFLLKLAELSEFEMYNKSKMQVIGICPPFSLTKALNPLNQDLNTMKHFHRRQKTIPSA